MQTVTPVIELRCDGTGGHPETGEKEWYRGSRKY